MSDAQRYQHIGSLVRSSPKMRELYPEATVYVLASDYDALRAELSAIKGSGEAVAVMYADGSVLTKAECGSAFEICCKAQTPLYTSPPVVAEAEPVGWRQALHEAVSAIYIDDSSDYRSALFDFVRNLAPELIEELASNPSAVWHKTDAILNAAPPASGAVPVPRELLERVISCGAMATREHEDIEAEVCALLALSEVPK